MIQACKVNATILKANKILINSGLFPESKRPPPCGKHYIIKNFKGIYCKEFSRYTTGHIYFKQTE